MTEKPISLAARRALDAGDNSLWTPGDMLRNMAEEHGGAPKAFAVVLDDHDGAYNWHWSAANMRASEMIALIEMLKHELSERIRGRA